MGEITHLTGQCYACLKGPQRKNRHLERGAVFLYLVFARCG